MQAFSRIPKTLLVLEGVGGILLVLSYFTLHQMLPLPAPFTGPLAATVMIFAGIALMLPAATVMMWRTAKAMAPDLFNVKRDGKSPGDKHDADH
ncbi:YbjC family protein [Erwinia sp. E_sp_B04_7]|uniref:YbjC family protein n=1 Tax=unclassified Erwinia TaxID=2622719 RepID=UPI0030CB24E4